MTYNVFGGTLNLTLQSSLLYIDRMVSTIHVAFDVIYYAQ